MGSVMRIPKSHWEPEARGPREWNFLVKLHCELQGVFGYTKQECEVCGVEMSGTRDGKLDRK